MLPLLRALALAAALPGPALAHAILMDSTPAPGATLEAGEALLTARFNSRVDHERSRLLLRQGQGAAATETVLPLRPSAADQLQAATTLTPGAYTLRWQVLAVDGHVTRGDVPFTVKAR